VAEDGAGRRGRTLLAIGAAAGLAAALWGALGPPARDRVGRDVIATVNGVAIGRADYQRALGSLVADKRSPTTEADARRVLDNLVDEQLLVERGLELGLGEQDIAVRKALIDAMVQFAAAGAAGREPDDEELRRYYAERPQLVQSDPQLRVRVVSFPSRDAARVESMRRALLDGATFDDAVRDSGAEPVAVPDTLLPPGKLADYAGPAVRDAALAMAPGDVAGPLDVGGVPSFVLLAERTTPAAPPFEQVRDVVAEEWRRRQSEAALAQYVGSLRRSASIDYAPDAPR
jgi:parvulin-like peptidyl-prolyl isomerase